MKHFKYLLLLCVASTAVLSTRATAMPLKLLAFQLSGIAVLETSVQPLSGHVAWIPSLGLGPLGVRAEIGITSLQPNTGARFFATNYEGFLCLGVLPMLTLELGGGLSQWMQTGGVMSPILSAYLVASVPGVLDRLFLGYSRFLATATPANEIKAGLGFSF